VRQRLLRSPTCSYFPCVKHRLKVSGLQYATRTRSKKTFSIKVLDSHRKACIICPPYVSPSAAGVYA
jgi:hypothetical protein